MSIKNAHPLVSFIYFALACVLPMLTGDPVILITALLSFVIYTFLLYGIKRAFFDVCFYLPLLLMIALINPIFSHNGVTPLFFLNGNPVTLEAVLCGVSIGVSVIGIMYIFKCFGEIMTEDKILYLLGNISPKFALMISMTVRFVPLFKERYKKTSDAQKTLGVYSSESRTDRIRLAVSVFSGVVSQSLEKSVEMSSSMKARGYGVGKRSCYSHFRFSPSDFVLLSLSLLLSLPVFVFAFMGRLDFVFYPRISVITPDISRVISYICFAVFALIPSLLEIKENIKWKYLISKV